MKNEQMEFDYMNDDVYKLVTKKGTTFHLTHKQWVTNYIMSGTPQRKKMFDMLLKNDFYVCGVVFYDEELAEKEKRGECVVFARSTNRYYEFVEINIKTVVLYFAYMFPSWKEIEDKIREGDERWLLKNLKRWLVPQREDLIDKMDVDNIESWIVGAYIMQSRPLLIEDKYYYKHAPEETKAYSVLSYWHQANSFGVRARKLFNPPIKDDSISET